MTEWDNIMTSKELSKTLCNEYDKNKAWPRTYQVDHDTYANVCQEWFNRRACPGLPSFIQIALGPNGGIVFHSVELILIRK